MTRRYRFINQLLIAALVSASIFIAPIIQSNSAFAASVGSSPCTSTVSDNTTVSVVYSSGTAKCYLIFLRGSNSWTVPAGITSADLLLIGGGGAGGGGAWAGGGGAGGVVLASGYSLTPSSNYSIAVGDSGTPGVASLTGGPGPTGNLSGNGGDTWFNSSSSLVAKGGGAGASYSWGQSSYAAYCAGRDGGSGGGATECNNGSVNAGGSTTQTLPAGATSLYGNAGGSTPNANNASGAGGGGSGAAGSAVTGGNSPGAGGNGTQAFASWISVISSAMPSAWQSATTGGYIAAGGGGAAQTFALGGSGGGGKGGNNSSNTAINGDDGVPNTGSGGGGGTYNGNSGYGGYGAYGLMIIRYAASVSTTVSIGLAGNVTSVTYRAPISITATLTGGNGKVRFFQDGKIIPGCQSINSSGLSATCTWRPSSKRPIRITAELVSGGAVLGSKSLPITVSVVNRAGKR